jgi:hypothetical protein
MSELKGREPVSVVGNSLRYDSSISSSGADHAEHNEPRSPGPSLLDGPYKSAMEMALAKAEECFQKGDTRKGWKSVKSAMKDAPDSHTPHLMAALFYFELNQFRDAERSARKASELEPKYVRCTPVTSACTAAASLRSECCVRVSPLPKSSHTTLHPAHSPGRVVSLSPSGPSRPFWCAARS